MLLMEPCPISFVIVLSPGISGVGSFPPERVGFAVNERASRESEIRLSVGSDCGTVCMMSVNQNVGIIETMCYDRL